MPPRRVLPFILISSVAVVTFFILSSSSRQVASDAVRSVKLPAHLQEALPDIDIPNIHFTIHNSVHRPPVQDNSTSGDSSWFSDYRWLNPFSSSVTLEEDRAVLPPQSPRPYIYTFYDTSVKKEKDVVKADRELLSVWRRAWWAQGFRPVILTQAEAMNNPLYRGLHEKGMPQALEFEFSRWLAWHQMGTGLLADYLCLPMAAYDDPMLSHLRRGQFEQLTRFDGVESGLFAGDKFHVEKALKDALGDAKLGSFSSIIDAIKSTHFKVEQTTALGYYDSTTVAKKYSAIADEILKEPKHGLLDLRNLITAHLHIVWQNTFNKGIAVLKPQPAHTTALVEPSLHLAQLLAECPDTLLPSSCPPNIPKCSPCVGTRMTISQAAAFKNESSLYTIATVPHPYTMITLNNQTEEITVPHIRRNTDRDAWITAVTRDVLGSGRGGPSRVVALKDAIASEFGASRSLWFTVEHFPAEFNAPPTPGKVPTNEIEKRPDMVARFPEGWLENIDWHFGFAIPRTVVAHGESMNPVPLPERWQKDQPGVPADKKKSYDPPAPSDEQAVVEAQLLRKSRQTIKSKDKHLLLLRDVAEKWNLSDMEIWRFVKAFGARSVVERKLWEDEESAYAGTGSARRSRWW